jgi:hypothetical protein
MSTAAHAPARSFVPEELQPEWVKKGAASLADALKIVSDLTAEELALLVGMVRERVSIRPSREIARTVGRFATGFTDAGKVFLDLVAGESAVMVDGFKEALALPYGAAAMADLVPRAVGTLVKMHKRALDAVGEQIQDLTESYAEGKSLKAVTRLAQLTREGVEGFIQTQKTFLDEVTEQVTIATEGGKQSKEDVRERAETLVELAREGVNKFIAAQKQILDLTIERMEADIANGRGKAAPKTSIADLTRESVEKFTAAQKALLSLALKSVPLPSGEVEPHQRGEKATAHTTARKTARAGVRKAAARSRKRAAAGSHAAQETAAGA